MIQAFQRFSQSRFAKIFLAIVALSFMAFFGGGSWFRAHDPNAIVAEVGNLSIGRYEFFERVQKQAQQRMAQTGESLSREDLWKAGFPQMMLSQLIQETLLDLEAKHLGLTVSDTTLRDNIQSVKGFQNEKGVFEHSLFTQLLRANGLSEDTFIAEVRQELIREQLMNAIMVGAHLPDEMVKRLFNAQYQHRQASMLVVSPKHMPVPPVPADAVLETFYKDHQKEFATPELRTLTAFVIDPMTMAADISVTEEEIKATYEAKLDSFPKKPLTEIRDLVLKDIQKEKAIEKAHQVIQELDDKIAGGATFEELLPLIQGAALVKLDLVDAQGRDRLGAPSAQLPQDKDLAQVILEAGFSLEERMDSPFAQDRNGTYYTVRVDKIAPAGFPSFAEAKDRVLKAWTQTEQMNAAKAKAEQYVNAFNQGDKKVSLMTLLPNLSLAEPSPSVSNEVKNLVFSLRPQQAGLTLTPEGFAVVLVNTILPPAPKTEEKKMASFREALLKQYQSDLLMSYLNALRVRYPVKVNTGAVKALYGPSAE